MAKHLRSRDLDFFSYLAKWQHDGMPLDGILVVMTAQLMEKNLTIINAGNVYHTAPDKATDLTLTYLGDYKFVKTEVGT